ncbi:MAG TPA: hypothetical protein VHV47_07315 [Opitutaceae bacterium]|jgi:hypothetical protein|nr:hypothetical protein [Opitutaceae bacterium]
MKARLSSPSRFRPADRRGMASVAVLLFAMVAVFIIMANFKLNYAVSMSGDAFDTFNSQTVEKNGVAQIVKESLLAVGETAPAESGNSVQTEIQNRLGGMTFPAGVSLSLSSADNPPSNAFFPFATPAAASGPAYFSSAPRGVAGMGSLFTSLAMQGPVADLGRCNYVFGRASSRASGENWTYTIAADLFSVPLTNVDVVAYGLPSSGAVPTLAPTVPPGTFGSGVSTLVVTSNNPANDPTAYPDLYAPQAGTETLPYQFRNAASFAWNAYEYLWNRTYQDGLIAAAQAEADPGNQPVSGADPTPPHGAVYDFSLPAFDPANSGSYPCNPTIAGVSASGNTLTIDCSQVQSQVLAIVDSAGVGRVAVNGTAVAGNPFILLVRNTAGALGQTRVTFAGDNSRPAIYYLENSNVGFSGDPAIEGALFFDPSTVGSGAVSWTGHFSFYGNANPLGTLAISINDSLAVKEALAPLAPRVLLVSTTATRQ